MIPSQRITVLLTTPPPNTNPLPSACRFRVRLTQPGGARRRCRSLPCAEAGCEKNGLRTQVCIIGSGPAAHTAAIYAARSELEPLLFEGFMANGVAAGGQLTTTTYVENFPGFPEPILGYELCSNFRKQSERNGVKILTETVERVDLSRRPFLVFSDDTQVEADTIIIATGAFARRLHFPGADTYWQKGISACAVCDGGIPAFRNQPLAVVGGGDVAMEEALYLTRYASKVYLVHRFDYLEASKVMQNKVLDHPKIEILWQHEVVEAFPDADGYLGGIIVQNKQTGDLKELHLPGLFFAIGHTPATGFLQGQVELDSAGYIVTKPRSTETSVEGVFAAGDVQDRKYRQAITSAGTGCMAAIDAERFLAHGEKPTPLQPSSGSHAPSNPPVPTPPRFPVGSTPSAADGTSAGFNHGNSNGHSNTNGNGHTNGSSHPSQAAPVSQLAGADIPGAAKSAPYPPGIDATPATQLGVAEVAGTAKSVPYPPALSSTMDQDASLAGQVYGPCITGANGLISSSAECLSSGRDLNLPDRSGALSRSN